MNNILEIATISAFAVLLMSVIVRVVAIYKYEKAVIENRKAKEENLSGWDYYGH